MPDGDATSSHRGNVDHGETSRMDEREFQTTYGSPSRNIPRILHPAAIYKMSAASLASQLYAGTSSRSCTKIALVLYSTESNNSAEKIEGNDMYYSKETLCSKQNYWGRRMRERKPASCRIRSGVGIAAQRCTTGFRVSGRD